MLEWMWNHVHNDDTLITLRVVATVAADLASEEGENEAYDEALCDLISEVMRGQAPLSRRQFIESVKTYLATVRACGNGEVLDGEYGRAIIEAVGNTLCVYTENRWLVALMLGIEPQR